MIDGSPVSGGPNPDGDRLRAASLGGAPPPDLVRGRAAEVLNRWLAECAAFEAVLDTGYEGVLEPERSLEAVGSRGDARWYIRMSGALKPWALWIHLRQRMVHFECEVLPAVERSHSEVYERLLRLNDTLVTPRFSIGPEDGIYLRAALRIDSLSTDDLDAMLGSFVDLIDRHCMSIAQQGYLPR